VWRFIESIGDKTLTFFQSSLNLLQFIALTLLYLVRPSSYHQSMRMMLVEQIYITAIKLLPFFLSMAFLFGSVIIGIIVILATKFNLLLQTGSIITTFVIGEFAPFFTALLLSLRASSVVNTDIALMKINNELERLEIDGTDIIDTIFLPRIISGIISSLFLSIVFASVMIVSGYIFVLLYSNMDFYSYFFLIFEALEIKDIVVLFIKSIVFGFFIMIIPIYTALQTTNSTSAVAISALNGMVRLFITLFFIEVLSLVLQSI
jgi:phospholipid/cholesterol/gamma-HCH transport system permease protein